MEPVSFIVIAWFLATPAFLYLWLAARHRGRVISQIMQMREAEAEDLEILCEELEERCRRVEARCRQLEIRHRPAAITGADVKGLRQEAVKIAHKIGALRSRQLVE